MMLYIFTICLEIRQRGYPFCYRKNVYFDNAICVLFLYTFVRFVRINKLENHVCCAFFVFYLLCLLLTLSCRAVIVLSVRAEHHLTKRGVNFICSTKIN